MKRSTWEKIPGSPRFSILQATESWVGPGNKARLNELGGLCCHQCYHTSRPSLAERAGNKARHHPRMNELGGLCRHQCYHTSRPSLAGRAGNKATVPVLAFNCVLLLWWCMHAHACHIDDSSSRCFYSCCFAYSTTTVWMIWVAFVTIRIYGIDKYTRICE